MTQATAVSYAVVHFGPGTNRMPLLARMTLQKYSPSSSEFDWRELSSWFFPRLEISALNTDVSRLSSIAFLAHLSAVLPSNSVCALCTSTTVTTSLVVEPRL